MHDKLIKWIDQILNDPDHDLEPVQGDWGTLYAGTVDGINSYLVFPEFDINYTLSIGLIEAGRHEIPGLGYVFALKWSTEDSEMALPFIYDLVQSTNLFTDPSQVLENKKLVWRVFDDMDHFRKSFSKIIGLWGEMKFVLDNKLVSKYWKGPLGTDADIISDNVVVEIKTTAKKIFESVTISSLWQLDYNESDIFMTLMRIENYGNEGESLYELQKKINKLHVDNRVLRKIESEMDSFGKVLCNSKFVLRDSRIYPVNDKFPFLTRRRLRSCLPQEASDRITKLSYSISISGLETVSNTHLMSKF